MKTSNPLKSGVARVDARLLLKMLVYIDSHGGVASTRLADELGIAAVSAKRMILNAREQYGVDIVFHRDGKMPSGGEYTIEHWGVFDQARVFEFVLANK
jgi:hypothetical protein